ncbi:MAG: NOB1 family endonuclease [Poseidonia sp.]
MERVLDTAALLHWPPSRLAGGVCAHSQRQELERLSEARSMLIDAAELEWRSPTPAALEAAKAAATASGDLARLSDVDVDVLALALSLQAVLVTDDYRLQNTFRHAGGTVKPVVNAASKQVWIWEQRCKGCGATSSLEPDVARSKQGSTGECRICGSPLEVKRRKG